MSHVHQLTDYVVKKMGLVLRNSVGGSIVFGFFLAIGTGIRSCNARERY